MQQTNVDFEKKNLKTEKRFSEISTNYSLSNCKETRLEDAET